MSYIYQWDHVAQVLLRRFQITHNLSLDGVLDFLNSKNMTEAGPLDLIDDDNSDIEEGVGKQTRGKLGYDLPGSLPNNGRPVVRTKCLRLAPTGRSFAAATTEGVLVYSIDDSFIFDPTDLDIDVTPEVFTKMTNLFCIDLTKKSDCVFPGYYSLKISKMTPSQLVNMPFSICLAVVFFPWNFGNCIFSILFLFFQISLTIYDCFCSFITL